jgi:hypothetical protein
MPIRLANDPNERLQLTSMATTTDTLQLKLALSGFAEVQAGIKSVANTIGALKTAALGFAPGLLIGLGAKEVVDSVFSYEKLSEQIGVSVEQASGLAHIADKTGVSIESLAKSFKSLSEDAEKNGRSQQDLITILFNAADVISKTTSQAERLATAQRLLGRAGVDLLPVLSQGSDALRETMDKSQLLAGVTAPMASNFSAVHSAVLDTKLALEGTAASIINVVIPGFTKMLESIQAGTLAIRAYVEAFGRFKTGLGFGKESLFAGGGAHGPLPLPEGAEKPEDPFLTKAMFDDQLKALELDQRRFALFESVAKADWSLAPGERLKQENAQIEAQLRLLSKEKDLIGKAVVSGAISKPEGDAMTLNITAQEQRLRSQIQPTGIFDTLDKELDLFITKLGSGIANIAAVLMAPFQGFFDGLTKGFEGLLNGTMRWSQALKSIETSVLKDLTTSFAKMAASWVTNLGIMLVKWVAYNVSKLAIHTTSETTATAITVANNETQKASNLKTGLSDLWNAAMKAGKSVADVPYVGPILAAIAFATTFAAGAALMAFSQGGFTGAGDPSEVAGVVHRGEFVIPASQVDQSTGRPKSFDFIMPAGAAPRLSTPAPSISGNRPAFPQQAAASGSDRETHFHAWFDESSLLKFMKDNPGVEHVVTGMMSRNRHLVVSQRG